MASQTSARRRVSPWPIAAIVFIGCPLIQPCACVTGTDVAHSAARRVIREVGRLEQSYRGIHARYTDDLVRVGYISDRVMTVTLSQPADTVVEVRASLNAIPGSGCRGRITPGMADSVDLTCD